MQEWHYTIGGKQQNPVGLEELRGLIANGTVNPKTDLVWNPSMTDWRPASEIPVVMGSAPSAAEAALEPTHPFAYPVSTGVLEEIIPGSEPIIATACVKRAFDLTVKHIGPLLGITLLYFLISWGSQQVLAIADEALGISPGRDLPVQVPVGSGFWEAFQYGFLKDSLSIPMSILSYVLTVFFMLGFTKVGLNAVSGKPFGVGTLFSGGKWLLHGFFGYIIYMVMVVVGLVFFIFPGIYLMLRFGMYQTAIVDKNFGVMEAFRYSSRLTTNNKANLFVIFLMAIGMMVAGCIALIVGILFAYPVIWLSWIVAYRWMQFGARAVMDNPATGQPHLAELPD